MDKTKGPGQLIIIGNGFDLHCGAKTSFSDFFESQVMASERFNAFTDMNNLKKKNLWYYLLFLYFYYYEDIEVKEIFKSFDIRKEIRWMDVETFIQKIIVKDKSVANKPLSLLIKAFVLNARGFHDTFSAASSISGGNYLLRTIYEYILNNRAGCLSVYDLLFRDLKRFEDDFSSYLRSKDALPNDYANLAESVILKMSKGSKETFVWSFNYTDFGNVNHIHGELEDNDIIIGIDQTSIVDMENNKEAARFTKAWRKLSVIKYIDQLPRKETVQKITIFGHSLSNQDYSYFHSIFNYYGLIKDGSNLVLEFRFTNHAFINNDKTKPDDKKNKENYDNYVQSIFALLNDYANNSVSEKEGKTVITRLLLERRVLIEELR